MCVLESIQSQIYGHYNQDRKFSVSLIVVARSRTKEEEKAVEYKRLVLVSEISFVGNVQDETNEYFVVWMLSSDSHSDHRRSESSSIRGVRFECVKRIFGSSFEGSRIKKADDDHCK